VSGVNGSTFSPGRTTFSRLLGVGSYRPRRVVTNAEICRFIESSDEWIIRRTGIQTRRFADDDETLPSMAATAASKALAEGGIGVSQLDCVLVATMSHLYQAPPLAAEVARRMGVRSAPALDLSAACAGFCYGLAMADHMILAGTARYVLVVGAERMSDIVDPYDRGCACIFGDGAGAVVVGPSDDPGIGPVTWGSDPEHSGAISQDASWQATRTSATTPYLRMAGSPVYRWVTGEMVAVGRRALDGAGVAPDELAAFIPHQANLRITEALAARLELPPHVTVADDIVRSGNTSAASIPLAMQDVLATGRARIGGLALLMGFGSGLLYAAQVVRLP
jgi:3-oxoacyl-(acyl-carrier-protein) synthase III